MITTAVRRNSPEQQERIISMNANLLRGALEIEPRYKDIRDIWAASIVSGGRPIAISSSFSHPNPNMQSYEIVGNFMLSSIAERVGIGNDQVLNVAHDWGVPHMDSTHGYTIQLAGFTNNQVRGLLRVLNSDIPYSQQDGRKFEIDTGEVANVLRGYLGAGPIVEQRISGLTELLSGISHESVAVHGSVINALIALREQHLRLVGIGHVGETPVSHLTERYADGLEAFDRNHGRRFYEMPLSERFQPRTDEYQQLLEALHVGFAPSAYMRGIYRGSNHNGKDRTGIRMPVAFDGETFAFSIATNSKLNGNAPSIDFDMRINEDGIAFVNRNDIYDAMRARLVVPAVSPMILVDCVGSQIPQLGAHLWREYAPGQAELIADWIGIDRAQIPNLILSTEGLEAFGVSHNHRVHHGFFMSYLTFGATSMRRAVEEGNYLHADWGNILRD